MIEVCPDRTVEILLRNRLLFGQRNVAIHVEMGLDLVCVSRCKLALEPAHSADSGVILGGGWDRSSLSLPTSPCGTRRARCCYLDAERSA